MAGATLFSLLDDITKLTSLAAKKTCGVVGDDLALNANQVSGVSPEREIPIVLSVAKGSAINKLILIGMALPISIFMPGLILPLLMVGGVYLCYEGSEKIVHKLFHKHEAESGAEETEGASTEEEKIAGAVKTDFVLSAEIMTLTLGMVAGAPLIEQIGTMVTVGGLMTAGVYGMVAGIVKLDDFGLHLSQAKQEGIAGKAMRGLGHSILGIAPWLLKGLSVAGTIAMFTVGGGIVVHGVPGAHALTETLAHAAGHLPLLGSALSWAMPMVVDGGGGVLAGLLAIPAVAVSMPVVSPVANFIKAYNPWRKAEDAAAQKPQSAPDQKQAPALTAEPVAAAPAVSPIVADPAKAIIVTGIPSLSGEMAKATGPAKEEIPVIPAPQATPANQARPSP